MSTLAPRYTDGVLLDLVGMLYDAAGDVGKWQAFVEAATGVFNSRVTHMLSYNLDRRQFLNFNIFFGVSKQQIEEYGKFLSDRPDIPLEVLDARIPLTLQYPGQAVCCSFSPDRTALERCEVYKNILHPFDIEYTLGMRIPHNPPYYSAMAIMRGQRDAPYDAEDVTALNKLAPHINRAIRLQHQLLEIDLQKRAALDALNLLPIGIVIADACGHALFANREAERLSQQEGGIRLFSEQVWAASPNQTAEIREKIRQAVLSAEAGKLLPGWNIALRRPAPRRPLVL